MEQAAQIGRRIGQIRKERGWTQGDLAEAVGVSRSAVAQWETGRSGQLTTNLARIASALDVGVEFLMQGPNAPNPMEPTTGDELALLRLYRECSPPDRQMLLRMARRLAHTGA
jgi:transcriptional regulator with XRE-family HTH domain